MVLVSPSIKMTTCSALVTPPLLFSKNIKAFNKSLHRTLRAGEFIVRLKRKAKNCFSRTERRCSSVQRACYRRHTGEKIKEINNNEREWHRGAEQGARTVVMVCM